MWLSGDIHTPPQPIAVVDKNKVIVDLTIDMVQGEVDAVDILWRPIGAGVEVVAIAEIWVE